MDLLGELSKSIAMTAQLGIQDLRKLPAEIQLSVALDPHLNHKKTAFGGSLYSLGALACYALVWSILPDEGLQTNDLVIQRGEIEYLKPIDADFQVVAKRPSQFDAFINGMKRKQKSRITLSADFFVQEKLCAQFRGTYVAIL